VLAKLGSQGSALFIEGEETIRQPIIPASEVVDTTGAGDTFTAAFAVALIEERPKVECLRFAGTVHNLSFSNGLFFQNYPLCCLAF
jgi:ribokinase